MLHCFVHSFVSLESFSFQEALGKRDVLQQYANVQVCMSETGWGAVVGKAE